jgi:CheY-like chemotaxis protein
LTTVLIADDVELNRKCLTLLFRRHGYRVLEAVDGDQALRMTRAERPDVVLVDLLMPAMDGFEYTRQVRGDAAIAHTPIVFFSETFTPVASAALARQLGVRHMLQKSSTHEQILDAIRDEAASLLSPTVVAAEPDEFNREHYRLITAKLTEHVGEVVTELGECLHGDGLSEDGDG